MTRRRRRLLWLAGGVLVVFLSPYVFWHPRRLNHAGFEHVQNGMTRAEVERLMGGPPGIYYPTHLGAGAGMTCEGYDIPDAAEALWYDDKQRYEIWFDDSGRVVGKHRRAGWYATTFSCRLFAMFWAKREPTPLEPFRYQQPALTNPQPVAGDQQPG